MATPVKAAPCFDRDTPEKAAKRQRPGEPEGGLPSATIAKVPGQIYADERGGSTWVTNVLTHECHRLDGSWRLEFDSDGECGVLCDDTTGQLKELEEVLQQTVAIRDDTGQAIGLTREKERVKITDLDVLRPPMCCELAYRARPHSRFTCVS